MNKAMKKTLVLGIVLCLILCATLLAACGSKTKLATYTVKVTCEYSEVIANVKVILKDTEGNTAGEKELSEGKATFELPPATYTATLTGVEEGYDFEDCTLTATENECTIEVAHIYTVNIKYKDVKDVFGNVITSAGPAEGVTVSLYVGQLADDNLSRLPTTPVLAATAQTDATGKAQFILPGEMYTVVVSGLAAGQSIDYGVGNNRVLAYTVNLNRRTLNLPLKEPAPLGSDMKNTIPLKLGENDFPFTQEILEPTEFSGIFCTFTPEEAGTYTFTTEGNAKIIETNDPYEYMNEKVRGSGTFELQLKAGETVSLLCGVSSISNMHYTLTIEKSTESN